MRIAVLGSGGVGGYYGALLARSGQEVTFIARGPHLSAIQRDGLRVKSAHGDFDLRPARATDDPAQVREVDLVLVAVKSFDLEAAAQAARPMIGNETVLLPLLNGLDAADRLAAIVGDEHVMAGLTHLSSSIASPGVICQTSAVRRITFGERNGEISQRAKAIRDVLAASGPEVVLSQNIDGALWDKFAFIASISGVCCLARQPIGRVLGTAETRRLFVDALFEVEAVAKAKGVGLSSDVVERSVRLAEGFSPQTKPSLLIALEAGQRLELESMSGTVVRLGQDLSVPTPVHRVIYAALKPSADGPEQAQPGTRVPCPTAR